MLWFTKDKRARMTRRYKDRAGYANLIKRDLSRHNSLPALIGLTEAGFSRAEGDEHEFVLLFREPMPDQLRLAVHLETDLWVRLRTTLDAAKNAGITPLEYNRLLPQLRENLTTLAKVLDLEAEILYSPLRNHFIDELIRLRKAEP